MAGASPSAPPAGSPASMLLAAFSPRPSSPGSFLGSFRASGDPLERVRAEEGSMDASGRSRGGAGSGLGSGGGVDIGESSPARANQPGWGHASPAAFSEGGGAGAGGGGGGVGEQDLGVPRAYAAVPSEALSCLPPRRRAQILLQEMAGLVRRALELARSGGTSDGASGALGLMPKQVSIPQLLPTAVLPPEASNAQTSEQVMQMLQVQQYLLTEAVNELHEIEILGRQKKEVRAKIEASNTAMKSFALNLYSARDKLSNLLNDYKDYRHLGTSSGRSEAQGLGGGNGAQGVPQTALPPEERSEQRDTAGTPQVPGEPLPRQEEGQLKEGRGKKGLWRKRKGGPGRRGRGEGPVVVDVRDLVAYSEHISLTTFAPPESVQGRPSLARVLPPCPQEDHLRASQLYACSDPASVGIIRVAKELPRPAGEPLESDVGDGGVGVPSGAPQIPGHIGAGMGHIGPGMLPPMPPPGWKPGDPIGRLMEGGGPMPPPPPGWKPGDPVGQFALPPVPDGWKPGDSVGKLPLPPMPAGWKPGDPVPIPQLPLPGTKPPSSTGPALAPFSSGAAAGGAPVAAAMPPLPQLHPRALGPQPGVLEVAAVDLDFGDDDFDEDEEDDDESSEEE